MFPGSERVNQKSRDAVPLATQVHIYDQKEKRFLTSLFEEISYCRKFKHAWYGLVKGI